MRFADLLFIALLLFLAGPAWGQAEPVNRDKALLFRLGYAYQIPGGDLADRFGANFNLGAGLDFLSKKKHWIIGLEGQFLFGNEVKTDVLAGLRTPEGLIYGNDRSPADIQLRERGIYLGAMAGKLLPLSEANPRSALRITLGAGLLQHQIRIQDDPLRTVPQLAGEYRKGYDRLTNGLALQQFLGYQLLDNKGQINFYAGLELSESFTRSRRTVNFDTGLADTQQRLDLLLGLRVGWILPFYLKRAEEIYY